MTLGVRGTDDTLELNVRGEVDLASEPALKGAVECGCLRGSSVIVLDLADVSFMDSSGVRALLEAQEVCRRCHCRLLVTNPAPDVRRLLEIIGVHDLLDDHAATP